MNGFADWETRAPSPARALLGRWCDRWQEEEAESHALVVGRGREGKLRGTNATLLQPEASRKAGLQQGRIPPRFPGGGERPEGFKARSNHLRLNPTPLPLTSAQGKEGIAPSRETKAAAAPSAERAKAVRGEDGTPHLDVVMW